MEWTMGQLGGELIDDTDTHTGVWRAMVIVNETVVNAITASGITNISGLATLTLPAGLTIYGNITSVDLTSGVVCMYK